MVHGVGMCTPAKINFLQLAKISISPRLFENKIFRKIFEKYFFSNDIFHQFFENKALCSKPKNAFFFQNSRRHISELDIYKCPFSEKVLKNIKNFVTGFFDLLKIVSIMVRVLFFSVCGVFNIIS